MPVPSREDRRDLLRADCGNCFGLCCVALSFTRSTDFAIDKPAGDPCVNLQDDFGCGIHERLRPSGFKGCTVFDCFGAGQRVAQGSYNGRSWRDEPESRREMFAVFPLVRDLHELLWFLSEALEQDVPPDLARALTASYERTSALTELAPDRLLDLDAALHRADVAGLLDRVSEHVRSHVAPAAGSSTEPPTKSTRKLTRKSARQLRDIGPRADLIGRTLAGADLRGANLRGAYLIAADLRGCDLTAADLVGADLRDARLERADLSRVLFLTQQQVNSAIGDVSTRLPAALERPAHWR